MWKVLRSYPRAQSLIWKSDPKGISLYFILLVIAALGPPLQFYFSKIIVDRVSESIRGPHTTLGNSFGFLAFILAIQVLIWSANIIIQQVGRTFKAEQALKLQFYIERLIISKSASLEAGIFENRESHKQFQNIREVAGKNAQSFLGLQGTIIQVGITLISMLIIVERLSTYILLAIFVLSLPHLYVSLQFGRHRFNRIRQRSETLSEVNYITYLLGSYAAAKEIKLLDLRPFLFSRMDRLWTEFLMHNSRASRKELIANILLMIPASCGIITGWLFAINQAFSRSISLGSMVMYLQATKSASDLIAEFYYAIGNFYESSLFLVDVFAFLDIDANVGQNKTKPINGNRVFLSDKPITGGIEFRGVFFKYPGESHWILQDMSFCLKPGEHIAIVGRNGSGKTTIMKLLMRMYDPTEGTIILNGHDIKDYDINSVRQSLGVMFQDFNRFEFTVGDNIAFGNFGASAQEEQIMRAAERAQCAELLKKMPQGLSTRLGRTYSYGTELSGGEWQRIALARSFIRDAAIVILDEPTSALDPIGSANVITNCHELLKGRIFILISHRLTGFSEFNRILVLDEGKVIESGSHGELIKSRGIYYKMVTAQGLLPEENITKST